MTNVVEDFKRTKKHPMARCLIKYPLVLLFVASAILLGLAFIGGSAINVWRCATGGTLRALRRGAAARGSGAHAWRTLRDAPL